MDQPAPKSPPDAAAVPAPGTTIGGKYRVEEVLGRGGMGVVLGARHEVLGHRVAIKLLASAAGANPTQVARFLREARATLELKSEHVVRVLDEGKTDEGAPFLVMEHLEGEDLHRLISRRGPLPLEEAVEYVLEACDAMVEAHARGIVHRDLKPSNLFLTTRGDGRPLVKVLDFGISKLATQEGEGELTETLAILGSPGYMAPEQIRNAKHADHRADVWGFGVVLFRLLTRAPAFEGEGAMGLCAAILSDPPKKLRALRPELPAELEAVIARCLEKDPVQRFQSVTDLARALAPFAPDSPTAARFRATSRLAASATLDLPGPVVEAATNAAVTHGVASAAPRVRWAYGVVAVAALGIGVGVLRVRGADAPATATAPATAPASAPATATATAFASASASAPATAPAPASAPASASASASAAKAASKKPVVKPAVSVKKPWGATIDDPL